MSEQNEKSSQGSGVFTSAENAAELESVPKAYSADELKALSLGIMDEIDDSAEVNLGAEEQLVSEFKARLLDEVDRFGRVFTTGKGSTYFVCDDGASLRIKEAATGRFKVQPMMRKQVLVSGDAAEELLKTFDGQELIGKPIPKAPYEVGATPFEFGIIGMPELKYSEDADTITILGDQRGVNASGSHVGHPITEILK